MEDFIPSGLIRVTGRSTASEKSIFQFITIFLFMYIPQTAHHSCSTPANPALNSRVPPASSTMLPRATFALSLRAGWEDVVRNAIDVGRRS